MLTLDATPRIEDMPSILNSILRLPLATLCRFSVSGDSMQPGLAHGDRMLVDRLAFSSTPPSRGDVIVLLDPGQPGVHCVKRVIGLPGEHVSISEGVVLIDDRPLHEPYLAQPRSYGYAVTRSVAAG